jgi:hypothetical protein
MSQNQGFVNCSTNQYSASNHAPLLERLEQGKEGPTVRVSKMEDFPRTPPDRSTV